MDRQDSGTSALSTPATSGTAGGSAPSRPSQPPPGASPHMPHGSPAPQQQQGGGGRGGPPPPSYREYDERKPLKRDLRREEEYQTIDHDYPNDNDYEDKPKEVSGMHRLIFIITRLLAWACAGLIILVGIAQWFEYLSIDNLHVSTYVVASYLIFFGLLFVMSELTDWGLRTYFGLLFSYTGRGLAYIFVGSLCFGMADERYWPLGLAVGCSLLGVGVMLIFVGWAFAGLPPLEPFCHSSVRHVGADEEDEEKRYRRDY